MVRSTIKVLPSMSAITKRLMRYKQEEEGDRSVTADHIRSWQKRWSWVHLLIGQSSDNQLFVSAFWWRRLGIFILAAALLVGVLMGGSIISFAIPMVPMFAAPFVVAIPLGIALNFGLDFLRDYLVPTTGLESYMELPAWLQWFFRANDTDQHGRLVRQCVGDKDELGAIVPGLLERQDDVGDLYHTGQYAARYAQDAASAKAYAAYRYSPVGNTYRSWLRGLVFIVTTLLSVAALTSALSPAGLLALAMPGAVSLGLATLAALCNRAGMRLAQTRLRHSNPDSRIDSQWKESDDQGRQWLANTLFAASGVLAMLSVIAVAWVGWPQLLIAKTFALLHLPAITSVPVASVVFTGIATTASLAVGVVVGSLRSFAHWLSGARSLFTAAKLTGRIVHPDINADDSVCSIIPKHEYLVLSGYGKPPALGVESPYRTALIDEDSGPVPS